MTNDAQNNGALDAKSGEPRVIVRLIGPDHPEHPNNRAKREAEAAQRAAEETAAAAAAAEAAANAAPPEPLVKKRRMRRKPRPAREPAPTCDRHGRKCTICADPYRDEIEELFLDWRRPSEIASEMGLPLRTLYRHAHATGLYAKRQGKLRTVLDRILEGVDRAHVTGDCIIRAVRAYSCLGRDNKWIEPPTRVIFSSQSQLTSANSTAPIDVTPKIKRLPPATRRDCKNHSRKSRVLIDTKTIRNRRISLKTRSRQ